MFIVRKIKKQSKDDISDCRSFRNIISKIKYDVLRAASKCSGTVNCVNMCLPPFWSLTRETHDDVHLFIHVYMYAVDVLNIMCTHI